MQTTCLSSVRLNHELQPFLFLIASFPQPMRKLYETTTTNKLIRFFKVTNQISGKWKTTFATFHELAQYQINNILVQTNRKILYLTDWILRFQNRCNKVVIELCVVQLFSEIILVTSNETRTAHLFDLKSRVWFQTKLHFIYLNYISNQSILWLDF